MSSNLVCNHTHVETNWTTAYFVNHLYDYRSNWTLLSPIKGWRMVKSETRRDTEILVRNPSPRLFGKKFRDSKKVNTNHAKTRLRDLSKTLPRFRDPAKIFRDPHFSRYHSPPLNHHYLKHLIPLQGGYLDHIALCPTQ